MTLLHAIYAICISVIFGIVLGYGFRGKEVKALQAANASLQKFGSNVVSKL